MAFVNKTQAAMRLGISIELLDWFVGHCPKMGQTQKLPAHDIAGEPHFSEDELNAYRDWLRQPWPKSANAARPHIPDPIKEDVKAECHYGCAICGSMDNGEVAHIIAVSASQDNSPDNLLYLCPNHHTKYDKTKPGEGAYASNVRPKVIEAAKLMKRESRIRILRYEDNARLGIRALTKVLESLEMRITDIQQEQVPDAELVQVIATETRQLVQLLPELIKAGNEAARSDKAYTGADAVIAQYAPTIMDLASDPEQPAPAQVRSVVSQLTVQLNENMFDLGEETCPHCEGRGMTGLVGDPCAFCGGSCFVPTEKAHRYDPAQLDEVECPRCEGRGLIGLGGDWCPFCHGSQFVSRAKADEYDPDELDEVECPRCIGTGQTGYGSAQEICIYCNGNGVVTEEKARTYRPAAMADEECPHCEGRGTRGFSGDYCLFCGGKCFVARDVAQKYDPADVDEVDCPHCGGTGFQGISGECCRFCLGSRTMDHEHAEQYDPSRFDEVECPRCRGRGQTGFAGDICALCRGDQIVKRGLAEQYRDQYGDAE